MGYTVVFEIWKKPEADEAEFMEHWTGEHAELVTKVPLLKGYEIMRVTSSIDADDRAPGGFVVLRFDSREDADTALASPEMAAAGADSQTYFSDFAAFHVDAFKVI